MAIFHWGQAWDEFRDLERQVDHLLATIRFPFPVIRVERHYPAVNIYELADKLLVTAELPGLSADALEVTYSQGILTLKGGRQAPVGVPDEKFRRHERFLGTWQRAIPINERIKDELVSATLNDGMLQVWLPKADEALPRQIPVDSTG